MTGGVSLSLSLTIVLAMALAHVSAFTFFPSLVVLVRTQMRTHALACTQARTRARKRTHMYATTCTHTNSPYN